MREFILRARKSRTDHNFHISDLRNAGHMEIVCACVSNALWFSNHLRDDTTIHVVLDGPPRPPLIISFDGSALSGMDYDERSIAQKIQDALRATKDIPLEPQTPFPGISVVKKSFEQLVKDKIAQGAQVCYLDPDGQDVRDAKFQEHVVFLFGDYIGMPQKSEKLLERLGAKDISLGPVTLFASHCAILVHNELDRRHYEKR